MDFGIFEKDILRFQKGVHHKKLKIVLGWPAIVP